MDTRKKLTIVAAACMLTAGAVTAQDYTPQNNRQYDRVAANDGARDGRFTMGARDGRFSRVIHRIFPQDDPIITDKFLSQATDLVEHPSEAPTTDNLMRRPSLD
jgi:hypothetical protein